MKLKRKKERIREFESDIKQKEQRIDNFNNLMNLKQLEMDQLEQKRQNGEITLKRFQDELKNKEEQFQTIESAKRKMEFSMNKIYDGIIKIARDISSKETRINLLESINVKTAAKIINQNRDVDEKNLFAGGAPKKSDVLDILIKKDINIPNVKKKSGFQNIYDEGKGYKKLLDEGIAKRSNEMISDIEADLDPEIRDNLNTYKMIKKYVENPNIADADVNQYMLEHEDEIDEVMGERKLGLSEFSQEGLGKYSTDQGLSTNQINTIMKKHKNFIGTVPRDKVFKLKNYVKPGDSVGFVINTDPASKPGKHWVGVYINPNSVNYFDSFGRPCPSDIRLQLKYIVDKMKPKTLQKFKENRIKLQAVNTNNCGFFVMKFLKDMFSGKPFIEATPFGKISKTLQGEQQIKKFKETLKPFSWF